MAEQGEASSSTDPPTSPAGQPVVTTTSESRPCFKIVFRLSIFITIVALILVFTLALDITSTSHEFLKWTKANKVAGSFAFAFVYAVATVLFVPGSLLSIGAGAVFGIWLGAIVVFVGATAGQSSAFFLGRYLLRESIQSQMANSPKWTAVDAALSKEGWKLVLMLRLAPILPYNLLNYALGLSGITFFDYTTSSCLGIIPGVFLFVYFGSLARDIAEVASGDAAKDLEGTGAIITGAVSGVVIILTVILTSIIAKRAIAAQVPLANEKDKDKNENDAPKNPRPPEENLPQILPIASP